MHLTPSNTGHIESHLGELAMRFRGTVSDQDRRAIADDYSDVVDRLIDGGSWDEIPAPEDQLPDAWMPKAFFEYWSGRRNTP